MNAMSEGREGWKGGCVYRMSTQGGGTTKKAILWGNISAGFNSPCNKLNGGPWVKVSATAFTIAPYHSLEVRRPQLTEP